MLGYGSGLVDMTDGVSRAGLALGALVLVAVAIPLAALAVSGHALPGMPGFAYDGLTGDAAGYYTGSRQFISKAGSWTGAVLALALIGVIARLVVVGRRKRLAWHWALVTGCLAFSAAVAILIAGMSAPGATAIGWPLVWSAPLAPLRAAGVLRERLAFDISVGLSLVAIAGTVVCTAVIGRAATGERRIGLLAAALFALWPLLVRPVAGTTAWENGSWNVLVGLAAYTEPISTFLVAAALALVVEGTPTPLRMTLAGIALGLATLVRVSNGLVATTVAIVCLVCLGWRRTSPLVAGGLAFLPILIAYWPLGYPKMNGPSAEKPAFVSSLDAAAEAWLDSLVFSPRTLAILVPLAIVGAFFIRTRFELGLLALPVLVNTAFYTTYVYTAQHPRYLYLSLPAVFVLWSAGASGITISAARWLVRPPSRRRSLLHRLRVDTISWPRTRQAPAPGAPSGSATQSIHFPIWIPSSVGSARSSIRMSRSGSGPAFRPWARHNSVPSSVADISATKPPLTRWFRKSPLSRTF